MMPYRLVESEAFKDLMDYAVPRYELPSRHFFSRKAIPALHQHVKERIVHALRQSVSTKKRELVHRPQSHNHSIPSAAVAHQVSHYGAATGKRQQAVLAMKCLGDNRHTAEVLSEFLHQETQSWLGTVDLEAGKVVSDNGRNFMAAISLSQLKHIPCLAHTLNLVVQCFLKSYPGLSDLLLKVRGLCAHIRRSAVHSSRMQTYQRSLNLPQHRLIIDVVTRWNSTLHMLQRLCEQRRAVNFLWEETHTRAGSRMADMELSGVQWSKIKDMCQVLQCFEECTRLVSADNAIISMSIPLMCLLMQSLTHIKDQASAPEEEESLDDSQPLSSQGSVQDEVAGEEEVEDEEDDGDEYIFNQEAFPGSLEIGGVARPGSGFLRDTSDVDLPATAPQPSTTADLTTGTLAHMADYALRILKRDTRITKMMNDDDYWLACLLDPRYKGKLQNIMPHENLELILATKQSTLVDRLLLAFPAHSARDRSHTSSRGQQTRVRPRVKVTGRVSGDVTKLHCQVYGFHPRPVDVKWMNGEDEVHSYKTTHVLPNPDGTYQIRASAEVTPKYGDSYSCYVDHSSLEEPLLVQWEPPQASHLTVVITVVSIVLILTPVIAGVILYTSKYRNKGLSVSGPPQTRRPSLYTQQGPFTLPQSYRVH
ncbi:unnamed protein product [Ranitomeya imitator]|uniref:Ig-like domain-containing protein n=1 Tax=Ranitomeya imitator TaxID=111125 RepID=A0ABN9LXR0_9NEOB|nr:unnamed protein product [Ranitomeya imitator]